MIIEIGNTSIHFQLVQSYGLAFGMLFYSPNLEPDTDEIDEDEYFERLTFLFGFFALLITKWEN